MIFLCLQSMSPLKSQVPEPLQPLQPLQPVEPPSPQPIEPSPSPLLEPSPQPCPLMPPTQHPDTGANASQQVTSQDAGVSAQLPLPLLALVNDEVHLGSGVFVKQEQWA
ncbi:amelogenin, X isoform-like [Rhipicephalus sanguineus]|uniref:amelogenin, X isoform-like n=1 Tax=Rhipicephalus sanguineus TaxID=34632 RepID=UPI001895C038|nr:amelogenin, X isoform-like [Rhipicephalus sanguineus]